MVKIKKKKKKSTAAITYLTGIDVRRKTVDIYIAHLPQKRFILSAQYVPHRSRTIAKPHVRRALNLPPRSKHLTKASIRPLQPTQPLQTFLSLDAPQVIPEHQQNRERKIRRRYVGWVPACIISRTFRRGGEVQQRRAPKAASGQLARIYEIDVGVALELRDCLRLLTMLTTTTIAAITTGAITGTTAAVTIDKTKDIEPAK